MLRIPIEAKGFCRTSVDQWSEVLGPCLQPQFALKVPTLPLRQYLGSAQCFPVWGVLETIARHECFWCDVRSRTLWWGIVWVL